jgi:hypothetical protein
MPVRKFRTTEDMERPHWRNPGDPQLYRTIARLWEFGRRTAERSFPAGVHRCRSVHELNAQTEQWRLANFARGQKAKRPPENTAPR